MRAEMTVSESTDLASLTVPQRWRVEELMKIGMVEWQAVWIARGEATDWSDARKLIEGGCPPHLAFDIVR